MLLKVIILLKKFLKILSIVAKKIIREVIKNTVVGNNFLTAKINVTFVFNIIMQNIMPIKLKIDNSL